MRVAIVFACLIAVFPLCAGSPVRAAEANQISRIRPLSDAELADARGGFQWGGMTINFGADMRTYLNGHLAVETLVSWTPSGSSTQTTVANGIAWADLASLPIGKAAGISLPALLAGNRVYLANSGQTAIIQGANNGVQNFLINSAGNLTALQQTNATVTLGNYPAFASVIRNNVIVGSLGREVAQIGR